MTSPLSLNTSLVKVLSPLSFCLDTLVTVEVLRRENVKQQYTMKRLEVNDNYYKEKINEKYFSSKKRH